MQGRRIYPDAQGMWFNPGDYGIDPRDGHWYARPPTGGLGSLAGHEVTEHADGSITVSPSILVTSSDENGPVQWHGYLERGVWRAV